MKERIAQWADRFIRLPVIGLDISDRSIKYVKLAVGRKVVFEFFGEVEVPEGIIAQGLVEREADLSGVLHGILTEVGGRFAATGAAVSLPEEKSFVRLLRLAKVKPEEVEGAIRWQMEGQIPLPPDEIAYDYELIGSAADGGDHLDAVITAFPRGVVGAYVRALKSAGFQPVALELESQAIARAVMPEASAGTDAKVVIDMGRNRTSFSIAAAGAIVFTTTLPIGGRVLEDRIAQALGVDAAEAARVKKEIGLDKDAYDGRIFAALQPPLETLADELARAVAYYADHILHAHGADRGIGAVILSGGDAALLGLDTYLASKIHVPVEIADPFRKLAALLPYAIPPLPKNQSLAFSAAIGLAMRGLR